jgi:polyhydroxyalkanoate synthesis regulator phasin
MAAELSQINLTLGTVGNEPGLYVKQQVNIVGQENADLRAKVRSEVGSELHDYSAYYVVPCASAEQATELKNKLTEVYNKAVEKRKNGEEASNFVEKLVERALQDPEEPDFHLHFESHGNNAILKLVPSQDRLEQSQATYEMVTDQVSDLLETGQWVDVELSLAGTAQDVFRSPSPLLVLGQGAKLHLEVNLATACAEKVLEVLDAMGAPEDIKLPLSAFSLFRSLNINLNFRSLDHLPTNVKGLLSAAGEQLQQLLAVANGGLEGENRDLVTFLRQFGDGSSHLFLVTPKITSSTYLKLTGVSSFLDSN